MLSTFLNFFLVFVSSFLVIFSKIIDRRLSVNKFLYLENDRSTSTEVIGAYLKNTISFGDKS